MDYDKNLRSLQVELVKLQKWISNKKLKVVVIFEGRDAAGKGGVIKRITQSLNPRICRVVALDNSNRKRKNTMVFSKICCSPSCRREKWYYLTVAGTIVQVLNT